MSKNGVLYPDGRMPPPAAADYLGLKAPTLAMMRVRGNGPTFVKLGGKIFYFRQDLDAWIASRRVSSTAQARLQAGNEGV